jgi:hypothetical protein
LAVLRNTTCHYQLLQWKKIFLSPFIVQSVHIKDYNYILWIT